MTTHIHVLVIINPTQKAPSPCMTSSVHLPLGLYQPPHPKLNKHQQTQDLLALLLTCPSPGSSNSSRGVLLTHPAPARQTATQSAPGVRGQRRENGDGTRAVHTRVQSLPVTHNHGGEEKAAHLALPNSPSHLASCPPAQHTVCGEKEGGREGETQRWGGGGMGGEGGEP